ncbi:MAG: ureidoglycolate lyase, partial [bacterium]
MKLIRFGEKGNEKPGVLVDDRIIDLSARYPDWNTEFFARGGLSRLRHLNLEKATSLKLTGNIRLGSPIARPGKIVCIGLNFHDHAREAGLSVPDYPPIFFKGANTIS